MKIFYLLISLGLFSLASAQNKNHKAITAADSIGLLKEFQKEMLQALEEDFKPSNEIKPDQLEDHALPQEINEVKAKELTKLFLSSFTFRPSPFSNESSQILIEFDNFFFPGPDAVQYKVKWLKALDKANKNHLLTDDPNASNWSSLTYGGQTFLKLKDTFQNKITKVEAEISIKIPIKLNIAKLDKTQLNKPFNIGTTPGRLLKLENDFASVWIANTYDNFQLIPFNADGQPLDVTSNTSFVFLADKETIKALNLPKDLGPGSLLFIKATGVIRRVDVYEVAQTSESINKHTLRPAPLLVSGIGSVLNEKYVNYIPKDFSNLKSVDTTTFKDKKRIQIKKSVNSWDKSVSYPLEYALPSDNILLKYAQVSFKDLKFYNKRKMVKESETDGFYDPAKYILYATPQNEEYNPLEYDEVQGDILIKYPSNISSKTFKKPDAAAGILAMSGNKLSLDKDVLAELGDLLDEQDLQALRVYGKTSMFPLKKDGYYNSEFKNDKSIEHLYFLGTITSVQMDLPTGWTEIRIPIRVTKSSEKTGKKN